MFKDIKALFEETFKAVTVDEDLYKKIKLYRINWAQKNNDHIEFLGGTLLGAQPVRFSTLDEDIFFTDVLNVDRDTVVSNIKITKGIDYRRKVEANPVYLSVVYLSHCYLLSRLPEKIKIDAVKELYYIFAYKTISSLIMHYFKFNPDISLLKVVESKLSGKFLIKQVGSWQELFEYRAKDILPSGLHFNRIKKLTTDDALRIVRDLQTRIRDIVKNIYAILIEVKENNEKIISTNNIVQGEDGVVIGDIINGNDVYVKELNRLLTSERDLIDMDLIYLLESVIKNLDKDDLITTLQYICNNDFNVKQKMSETIMVAGLDQLHKKGIDQFQKDFLNVLKTIRAYFISNHLSSNCKELKKDLELVVVNALKIKRNWRTMLVATNVTIYLFCRTIISVKK